VTSTSPASHGAARDLALVAIFAGIVAALGIVPAVHPFGISVPITAQSLGVMLAGAILGARRGALALVLLLALVALGLPLLAGGRGGLAQFAGPSVGYLVGWPIAAFVTGWLTERGGTPYRLPWGFVANVVGGIVVLYAIGIPGVAIMLHVSIGYAAVTSLWYVVGDLAKALIAALVARGVHAAYPGLLGSRAAQREKADVAA
jgi:biotin transport system substrate-specific component